jgi:hypothetical protein
MPPRDVGTSELPGCVLDDAKSCERLSDVSMSGIWPAAPTTGAAGSTSTIGNRWRDAATASHSRVC